MLFLRTLLVAFALLVSPPAFAQAGDSGWFYRGSDIAADPAWRFGTLPNGLRYAIRRNPLPAGQVSIRMRVDVGALHEEEAEQGWAHFVEHMVFRGTASFADREARHIWQQLGASFGSDTNATTSSTQTVYQLDLPRNDRSSLDTSLHVLADMAGAALFDPAIVDAERRVLRAEKERQPELSRRLGDLSRPLFYRGLRVSGRNIIGTDATLAAADAAGLRAFYRRWYRPERTTLVMVGDADPALMEALIRARFGGWRAETPGAATPDLGAIAEGPPRVGSVAHDGAPTSLSLIWLRPHSALPHTRARERIALEEMIAARIVNRRLEAAARSEAAYIDSRIGIGRSREAADTTSLSVDALPGRWREALEQSFAIIRDSIQTPPSAAEIDREVRNIRGSATAAVAAEPTTLSPRWADQMVGAIDDGNVVTRAAAVRDLFEANARGMSPARIGAAMRTIFTGAGPHLLFLGPQPIADDALTAGLASAQAIAPAARRAERRVGLDDLPAPGPPGREVSRERIDDLGVTIVRFANGATLTFKQTAFERGEVNVQIRFGGGLSAMPADRPSFAWLGGLIGPSGIGEFDLDAMERMMTGRRINLAFSIGEDGFALGGSTSGAELGDQLRLLTAKLAYPRWDEGLFTRFRTGALESYQLSSASAAARAGREFAGLTHPGDPRFAPIERAAIEAATLARMRDYFTPLLAAGPVHVVIVGDTTLDAAAEAVRRSVAALPARTASALNTATVVPPAPNPAPRTFTHEGAPDQAYAAIGWSTLGGTDRIADQRALALAANIFRVRLFERLREAEGATYSPAGGHMSSDVFPAWGIFYAAAELRPGSADAFFRAAREIVADMAANPAAADEFARAKNPVISGIERRLATNGYWTGVLGDFAVRPGAVAEVRSYLADYRALTAETVRAAVAAHVAEAGDWSMLVLPSRAPPTTSGASSGASPAPPAAAPAPPRRP